MNSFNCPNCGLKNWATTLNCKRCKIEFETSNQPSASNVSNNASSQHYENRIAAPTSTAEWQTPRSGFQNQNNQYNSRLNPNVSPFDSSAKLKTSSAVISMILGIVGQFTLGVFFVGSIIGLILGIVALQNANKKPHEYGGKGMSIAGIVLNALSVIMIPFFAIILAIAIPNLIAARKAANEASAIATIRTLQGAETTSIAAKLGCRDLSGLAETQLIDNALAARGEKSGYKFVINTTRDCEIQANPLTPMTGTRSFYASMIDGEIHYSNAKISMATANDPTLRDTNSYRSR